MAGLTGLGDPVSRRLVILCHPTPGASGFDPDPAITQHWGVHVLTLDRPGYGASDPWAPGTTPSVAAWADDVAAWVRATLREGDEHSAVDYRDGVGIIGWRSGAAYALALAAALGEQADRLVIVDAPPPAEIAQRARDGVDDVTVDASADDDERRRLRRMLEEAAGPTSEEAALAAAQDREALGDVEAWRGSLHRVRARTLLVYGSRLRFLAPADARWYARHLRRTRTLAVHGGLPIARAWSRILEHVAPRHGDIAS